MNEYDLMLRRPVGADIVDEELSAEEFAHLTELLGVIPPPSAVEPEGELVDG